MIASKSLNTATQRWAARRDAAAPFGVQEGPVHVRAKQREQRPVTFGEIRLSAREANQAHAPPWPAGQAHDDLVLDPRQVIAVHAGGTPLPRTVEARDLGHAAQIAAAVGVGAQL
jgi:hypothetical protein